MRTKEVIKYFGDKPLDYFDFNVEHLEQSKNLIKNDNTCPHVLSCVGCVFYEMRRDLEFGCSLSKSSALANLYIDKYNKNLRQKKLKRILND